jgi:hypothetical protein
VPNALVDYKSSITYRRVFTSWKVTSEWAKGENPVLGCVIHELRGRGKCLLLTPLADALEHTWGFTLVFSYMHLKVMSICDDLAAQRTLINFALGILRGYKAEE